MYKLQKPHLLELELYTKNYEIYQFMARTVGCVSV